ncbi:CHAT domain-containing protein [Mycena capillaripes]|nr:CHAT domain-containing protein [Mycena capillaripes]
MAQISSNCAAVNSIDGHFETMDAHRKQMSEDCNVHFHQDAQDLWIMHERVLFLPSKKTVGKTSTHARRNTMEMLGDVTHDGPLYNEAVCVRQDAVCNDPKNPLYLGHPGRGLYERFLRLGNLGDIHEAISKQRDVLNETSMDHPNLPDMEYAVHITLEGHSEKPARLSNLGNSLVTRFNHLGNLGDLNGAISKHEDAVRLILDSHSNKHIWLSNLGTSLLIRFYQLHDSGDLNRSISKQEDAVGLALDSDPHKPALLNNLGIALQNHFTQLHNLFDLEQSLQLISNNSPDQPKLLHNFGASLLTRFKQLSDPSDLEKCIFKLKDALRLTPDGHPDRPSVQTGLGEAFLCHYVAYQDPSDLEGMILQYSSAAYSKTGAAYIRFHAARMWAGGADIEQHPVHLEAYHIAFNHLPEVAWLGLPINDRQHQIIEADAVARDAAVAAIFADQPKKAVEWLEQNVLKQKHPDLGNELISLSAKLKQATTRRNNPQLSESGAAQSLASIAQQAHENALKRDLLLKKIRGLEGFHQFLLPKTISGLTPAAQKGPVVLLNVGEDSCNALVLMPSCTAEVLHVPLSDFIPEHVEILTRSLEHLIPYMGCGDIDRLYGHREGGSVALEDIFGHILSELWLRLVKPVLDALAITTPAEENLQRIWWCLTGPLTSLPIHAAGLYGKDDGFGSKLSDFVISSYTPSLTALMQGFCPSSGSPQTLRLLAVAQPSASGQSRLPGTQEEIQRIRESAPGKIPVCSLVAHEATVARVEDEIMKSSWVHFACYGVQDRSTPTESALLLAGSSKLTLERIIQLNLPHDDLAFLSACQTATGDKELRGESVHLAAGMLLAYRSVIATMWSIMDNDAPQVAKDVYEHLFKTLPPDSTRAAEALHVAVKNLREG